MSERGNEVFLISLPNHHADQDSLSKKVCVLYLPIRGTKGYYLNAFYLKRIYEKLKPDIINAHYASGYGTLARIAGLPRLILSVWGSDVYDFPYESKIKRSIIVKNLLFARHIASTSHVMAKQVCRLIHKTDISVTPFGVDTHIFKKSDIKDKNFFTVGLIKNLSPKYGIDTVITAFKLFFDSLSDPTHVRLYIYGKGEQEDDLRVLCQKLNISNNVFFKGYIPNIEVPRALNEFDIACFGSRRNSESFGVSAVEAMACEVPVIATDADGFTEVIENGVTGYIVPKNSPEKMAQCIQRLYTNKELCSQIGKNGRNRVKKLYEWEKCVDVMEKMYRSLL